MKIFSIIMALLMTLTSFTGCSEDLPTSSNRNIAEYDFEDLKFVGCCRDFSEEKTQYYKGGITGETARELYEIITEQCSQKKLTGGNYTGFESLVVTAPSGQTYTCYFTYDHEEYSTTPNDAEVDPGMPTVDLVGERFVIISNNSQAYEVTNPEISHRFYKLIGDYLKANYSPTDKMSNTGDILFVKRYTNYAWTPINEGIFMDSLGNWYAFDFEGKLFNSDKDFVDALYEHYSSSEPVYKSKTEPERIEEIRRLIDEIDPSSEVTEKHVGYDMGQKSLYVLSSDYELIQLHSTGDFIRTLEDENAKKLRSIYDMLYVFA